MPKNPKVLFETDDTMFDQSRRAEMVLEHILKGDREQENGAGPAAPQVAVEEARRERPIIDTDTGRTASRVLFVTRDETVLTSESTSQREYLALSEYFDEVHVMVLLPRRGNETSQRVGPRLWTYRVYAPYWWMLPFAARTAAEEMLVFNDSVRPDVILGNDQYEAGLAAYLIAASFARPLQLHIADAGGAHESARGADGSRWRPWIADFVLKRARSVRVKTQATKDALAKRYKNIADLALLPVFYNFSGYIGATPAFNLHDRYKDFSFIALTFAPLTADSALHGVMTALHQTLKTPRFGLIVIGEGPARKLFEEKAKLLGIEKSVVFLSAPDDLVSYLRTADVLVEASTTRESEEHVMRAAAAGLPIVAVATDLRSDLFRNGVSAFLSPDGDWLDLSQKFAKFINTPSLRKQFAAAGEQIARDRFVEDVESYYLTYRDSIESVLETVPTEAERPQQPAGGASAHASAEPAQQQARTIGADGLSYPTQ